MLQFPERWRQCWRKPQNIFSLFEAELAYVIVKSCLAQGEKTIWLLILSLHSHIYNIKRAEMVEEPL